MAVRRDPDIERLVAGHLEEYGLPTPSSNVDIVAFWDDKDAQGEGEERTEHLGIQIIWRMLVMSYAIQPMRVTTRHPFERASVRPESMDTLAYTAATEGLAMARYEWQRARRFWPDSYPVVEFNLETTDGSAPRALSTLATPRGHRLARA